MSSEFQQNPYEPPSETSDNESLTRLERRSLEFYLKCRARDPSLLSMLSAYISVWLVKLCLFGAPIVILAFIFGFSDLSKPLILVIGVIIGSISQDITQCRLVVRLWPLYAEIFDWQKIDEKLNPPVTAAVVDE